MRFEHRCGWNVGQKQSTRRGCAQEVRRTLSTARQVGGFAKDNSNMPQPVTVVIYSILRERCDMLLWAVVADVQWLFALCSDKQEL